MKSLVVGVVLGVCGSGAALAQGATLEGAPRLACEALLCLAAPTRPAECAPSIAKFFSITAWKPSDLIRLRMNFLNLCPTNDAAMPSWKDALARGAGACDVDALNTPDSDGIISNQPPSACATLYNHPYGTALKSSMPIYVGTPGNHGYWVAPEQYPAALASYNEFLRVQAQSDNGGGQ